MKCWLLTALLLLPSAATWANTITDQNGREVTLPDTVQRLAAIPIPLASMVMAIDGTPQRLIGMNSASQADLRDGLLARLYPEALDVPMDIAGENFVPNVEALAAAGADVVMQWGDRGDAIISPISRLGLPVVTLRYGDSDLVAGWLRLTGAALGKAERGEQLAQWFEMRMQATAEQARAIPAGQKPGVIYLSRVRSGLLVAGAGTSMASDIELAGGVNVAAGVNGFASVDIEQLMMWNPDIILLNNFEPDLTPDEVLFDGRFQDLSATRQQRIYSYPHGGFRWDPPSQETPLAVDWLFQLFHPEQARPDFRQRIREAYRFIYVYDASESDLDDLLKLQVNGNSADYRQLFSGEQP